MFDTLNLNAACAEQHKAVIEKGFTPQPVATNLMLIVSELGEACEADRKNKHAKMPQYAEMMKDCDPDVYFYRHGIAFELNIKDSFEDEIADAFLRLMDLCGVMNIDIEKHIRMKAEYNLTRPTKHGKAY